MVSQHPGGARDRFTHDLLVLRNDLSPGSGTIVASVRRAAPRLHSMYIHLFGFPRGVVAEAAAKSGVAAHRSCSDDLRISIGAGDSGRCGSSIGVRNFVWIIGCALRPARDRGDDR